MKYLKRFNEGVKSEFTHRGGEKLDSSRFYFSDLDYIKELSKKNVLDENFSVERIQKDLQERFKGKEPKFDSKYDLLDYLYDWGAIDMDTYKSEWNEHNDQELS